MKRFAMLLVLSFLVPVMALAEVTEEVPFPDEDYVSNYFGVSLYIQTTEPLDYPAEGWWTDALPQELLYNNAYAAGVINSQRSANGITPMIGPDEYFISPTYDEQISGGWQYTVEFIGLRPSEVQLLLNTLGGPEKYFPGATLSYMPLLRRSFSVWSNTPGETLVLLINDVELAVEYGESIDSIRERAVKLFTDVYGQEPMLDITMGQYSYSDGSGGSDFTIYAELPAG